MKELKDMSLEELWELFPIVFKGHNPEYKTWFDEEKKNLVYLFNDYDICRINHIGSTSVNGLTAKPIIDILLELDHQYDGNTIIRLLQNNGWIVMARDDTTKIIGLNKGYTPSGFAEKVFHLHIKPSGDWDELYFRDYLRKYPDVVQKYETLKWALKRQFEYNRDAYTHAKTDFIREQTLKARAEFGGRYLPSQK
ncbi:MAG: GrpB family protein [Christensenellales bacterium]